MKHTYPILCSSPLAVDDLPLTAHNSNDRHECMTDAAQKYAFLLLFFFLIGKPHADQFHIGRDLS
jgi:hypothetical protein